MATAGKIYPTFTKIEIDEKGRVWLIQNHFESETVIEEMEEAARGRVIVDEGYELYDDDDYDLI
jgi:hypothetical protein